MTKVKIITDSTARLTPEEVAQYDISVVPLTVMIDGTVYHDGVSITPSEFIEKMAASKNLPTTSQPSLGAFTEVYETVPEDVEVLSLHLTHHLSGTVQAAEQAARLVPHDIVVRDSNYIDRALAAQVLVAGRMAQAGASRDEILAELQRVEDNTELYLTVTTLKNLVAGGRLSKASGLIGTLLDIKLGAHVPLGKITMEVKGRGKKTIKGYQDLIFERMHAEPNGIAVIGISHADAAEEAEQLAARARDEFPEAIVDIAETTPIESTHAGPGAMGISYLKNYA
ncbi:DegV family protein [Weissella cibaria]|jgi:DegV family protein with EDD domain|uniref:Fatty acid-binding protein DegV n=1 Tax=Weissella cibaria TaxID=137591 RepID=A0A1X4JJC2_9LACO|nr:DegV family protein [Weissella cibaria]MBU7544552.1 DegV family protein [Weissella cibaria]MBU7562080.1 DegV family protein [Weissella cibaria]MBZ6068569.1 DegV family protein [Weissella cibaria]MCA1356348.1 DegV family protein [Weissella cibaria]MCT0953233.1 DegV family protein [Weissella cibaria]